MTPTFFEHQVLLLPPPYTRSGDRRTVTKQLLQPSRLSSRPLQHDGSRSQGCPGHCCSSPGSSPGCPCCATGCHLIRLHQASALLDHEARGVVPSGGGTIRNPQPSHHSRLDQVQLCCRCSGQCHSRGSRGHHLVSTH